MATQRRGPPGRQQPDVHPACRPTGQRRSVHRPRVQPRRQRHNPARRPRCDRAARHHHATGGYPRRQRRPAPPRGRGNRHRPALLPMGVQWRPDRRRHGADVRSRFFEPGPLWIVPGPREQRRGLRPQPFRRGHRQRVRRNPPVQQRRHPDPGHCGRWRHPALRRWLLRPTLRRRLAFRAPTRSRHRAFRHRCRGRVLARRCPLPPQLRPGFVGRRPGPCLGNLRGLNIRAGAGIRSTDRSEPGPPGDAWRRGRAPIVSGDPFRTPPILPFNADRADGH